MKRYTHKKAIADCKTLWKYLAENTEGVWEKPRAVEILYQRGEISREKYRNHCPLCELYLYGEKWLGTDEVTCENCPWPDYGFGRSYRCEDRLSPYINWSLKFNVVWQASRKGHHPHKQTILELQKLATSVYNLVKTFK